MTSTESKAPFKVIKTDEEWRALLTPDQYRITRQHGTERAFSSPDFDTSRPGVFRCVCCNRPLYRSTDKYESGTGWPSFTRPASASAVNTFPDHSYGMVRTEVRCADCDAHLGHVFPDGPPPAGLRYCMNGHALVYDAD
ncbi:MAG: Peptide methionine sulfoxide reductase MsrB [Candidatus Tokpelaia hoelldobleri]|uniref:peptide-methionine (R)-S-oxide reductase n=1 Tax=Candidatus Tokpelaia hoelldobleri TaxID=1902579 RepID=A0A1U9JVY7_9HYPH|nr:MAG: Peptide methionine sulfoxide reductase MsrB [Candidatus Tokpelaia hoelldoblerii]